MPIVEPGWTQSNAFFMVEDKHVTIGLCQGRALEIFNNSIKT